MLLAVNTNRSGIPAKNLLANELNTVHRRGTYAQYGRKHRILLLGNSLQSEHHCTWLICIFLDETAVQFWCGNMDKRRHFHSSRAHPTHPHVSHSDMVSI